MIRRLSGYRAQPDFESHSYEESDFIIHLPVFEKYSQDYKLPASSKKVSVRYLGYISRILFSGLSL